MAAEMTAVVDAAAAEHEPGAAGSVEVDHRRAFLRWGGGAYLLTTLVLGALALRATGGRPVYLLDDTAIHLSIAENLAHHGTWGVVPGRFESASSSPLWTVLLAAFVAVTSALHRVGLPLASELGPLVLNLAGGLWALRVLAANQRVLLPSRRRPLDVAAVVALVVVVLFLPALTLLGMEHTLHVAAVLSAVVLVDRRCRGGPTGWPPWLPHLLLALATLLRFETAFVAVGLATAVLVGALPRGREPDAPPIPRVLRRAAAIVAASVAPLVAFGLVNRYHGQGWLPNSVLAKAQGLNGGPRELLDVFTTLSRLTEDPVLALVTVVVLGALIAGGHRLRRARFLAIAHVVAVGGHVVLARMGWFERYQAYLIALGVLVLLTVADDLVPAPRRPPARAALVPGLVLISLLACSTKARLTVEVPVAAADTHQQRYLAGVFLGRYYDGQPVATGELGYISRQHRGPLTDLLGLGDHEVLEARRAAGAGLPAKAYWTRLASDRGFTVAAVYPSTLMFSVPDHWVLVGTWTLDREPVTAYEATFQFWATTPDVETLRRNLEDFAPNLPAGATLHLQPRAAPEAVGRAGGK